MQIQTSRKLGGFEQTVELSSKNYSAKNKGLPTTKWAPNVKQRQLQNPFLCDLYKVLMEMCSHTVLTVPCEEPNTKTLLYERAEKGSSVRYPKHRINPVQAPQWPLSAALPENLWSASQESICPNFPGNEVCLEKLEHKYLRNTCSHWEKQAFLLWQHELNSLPEGFLLNLNMLLRKCPLEMLFRKTGCSQFLWELPSWIYTAGMHPGLH